MKKYKNPGDMYNAYKKKKMAPMKSSAIRVNPKPGVNLMSNSRANMAKAMGGAYKAADKAGSFGTGFGGDSKKKKGKKAKKKLMKTKPQGKGIVKALGQKGTTGNFKKIEKKAGKGAAISALQNKLAKRRGKPMPFKAKKKMDKDMEC